MGNYIDGKVIIVTGAGSGFGKLVSEMVADMSGKVICADINEDGLKIVVSGIKAKGGSAEYIVTDVTNKEQVDKMARFAIDTYKCIDVLVNNAGIMPLAFFSDHEKAWRAWDKCIDINLKGIIYGISAVYDQMMEQGRGHIVNISSIYGNYPVVGSAVYQATKVGVRFLTEGLRQETQGVIKTTIVRPTGIGGTGLGETVVNGEAIKGLCAQKYPEWQDKVQKLTSGTFPSEWADINSPKFFAIEPKSLAENVIYCINQPWGINISDITVRATGEDYMI
jgi:NADP-dependent 3-hydroxy acid dehydrogenase YdfG